MMRLLVTGREGQVARALAERAAAQGVTVVPLARPELDLSAPETILPALRRAQGDIAVNAAAYTAVDRAEVECEAAFMINATAPRVMAEALQTTGGVLVHYSTDYVFDGAKRGPYFENDRPNPLNAYGRSKLEGEQAIRASGIPHLILRTSWVYSRTGRNFLTTMERLARERDELRVVADQTGVPNWTRALARITAALIARGRDDLVRHAGLYHVSAQGEATWHAFARAILDGRAVRVTPITTAEYPTRARRPRYAVLDASRFANVFGLALPHWTEVLRECLRSPAEPPPAIPTDPRLP